MYYALTGEPFNGKRAAEIGLATMAVPKDKLKAEVRRIAEALREKDAIALKVTKDVLKISQRMDYEEAYAYSVALAGDLTYKQDGEWMKSGIGEFMEGKSRPGFNEKAKGLASQPASVSPPPGTISALIADYLLGLQLSDVAGDVQHFAKLMLLDCLGCMVAGAETPSGRAALALGRESPLPQARLVGTGERVALDPGRAGQYDLRERAGLRGRRSRRPRRRARGAGRPSDRRLEGVYGRSRADRADRRPRRRRPHRGRLAPYHARHDGRRIAAGARRPALYLRRDRPRRDAAGPRTRRHSRRAGDREATARTRRRWRKVCSNFYEPPMTKYDLHRRDGVERHQDAVRLASHGFTGDRDAFEGEFGAWRYSGGLGCDWSFLESFGGDFMIAPTFFKPAPCNLYDCSVVVLVSKIVAEHHIRPDEIARMVLRPPRDIKGHYGDGSGGSMAQWLSLRLNAAHGACGTRPYSAWQDGEAPPAAVARLVERSTIEPLRRRCPR